MTFPYHPPNDYTYSQQVAATGVEAVSSDEVEQLSRADQDNDRNRIRSRRFDAGEDAELFTDAEI